ncbi:hypothetical protein M422DRAFT_76349 [Sphaerobolus stellatus SS14]|uniref:non-specific serine/threonine protein kinase n=1 Tax=Sphaerobolus stellatus (strain SS14) TaxID=990650 RepID=A0A0C9V0F6_SPHS4|nr:hypothetical protein M422DRAFT_76349 [Sphaerobolus stellatus SS14]
MQAYRSPSRFHTGLVRHDAFAKLGWGHFSTVWLARDTRFDRHVALKIVRSAPIYTETALDEIKLLQHIISSGLPPNPPHPGRRHVVGLLDHFRHQCPNGNHVCMVFEVLGENLLGLVKRYQDKGVPMHLVKQISKQILLGVDYLHRQCGMIHTDFKLENILIYIDSIENVVRTELSVNDNNAATPPTKPRVHRRQSPVPVPESLSTPTDSQSLKPVDAAFPHSSKSSYLPDPERITVKVADLGNATWADSHFTENIQTRQYRCPEVIIGAKWGPSADIWSVACIIFELLTGDILFQPASGSKYTKNDDHLAQMIELVGEFPKSLVFSGKYRNDFFNSHGELQYITKLRSWPLDTLLYDKYLFTHAHADAIASFLGPMLRLHPDKRAKASELIHYTRLEGIMVEG